LRSISLLVAAGLMLVLCTSVLAWKNPCKAGSEDIIYTPRKKGTLTFNKDVAPIVFSHCVVCHRPGEVAPFSLLSYADVKKRAQQIAELTERRYMPPWKADSHGEFEAENRLTGDQAGVIRQWVDEACAEGEASSLPEKPKFTSGWQLGPPDAELAAEKSFALAASGPDEFHTFLLRTNFPEDRYLSAVEVRPGNRAIVHHTIVSVDTFGTFRKLAAQYGRMDFSRGIGVPDGVLDIWAPGKIPERLPHGVGMLLPKGADVLIEIHYHRSGKPETDRTKIGLYFSNEPVRRTLHVFGLRVAQLSIPPGDANYQAEGQIPVLVDATLLSVFPHMHQIGKSIHVTLTLPDGTERSLVDVPDWDYNWQNTYRYKQPVKLPRGSHLKMTATYDNSVDNPRNPNTPPKNIDWGEQTTDEMGLALFAFTVDAENLTALPPEPPRH